MARTKSNSPFLKTENIGFTTTKETREGLREVAEQKGITISKLVNQIVEEYLKEKRGA